MITKIMLSRKYLPFVNKSKKYFIKNIKIISNIILTPRCSSCGVFTNNHHHLCSHCWNDLTFISSPQCQTCGYPLPYAQNGNSCGNCLLSPPPFTGWSIFIYENTIRKLIIRFKHGDATYLAPTLAKWLYSGNPNKKNLFQDFDYLIPVPLHRTRMIKRQFNQATLLCRELEKLCGIPTHPLALRRHRNTTTQHLKSKKLRFKNVQNAFYLDPKYQQDITGKNICLIDDVWTTGATITSCAQTLLNAGAKKVSVITVARVLLD